MGEAYLGDASGRHGGCDVYAMAELDQERDVEVEASLL